MTSGVTLGVIQGVICLRHVWGIIWGMLGASSEAYLGNVWGIWGMFSKHCLGHHMGHHLGHAWGIIWGMSVASSGACLGQSEISAVLHAVYLLCELQALGVLY